MSRERYDAIVQEFEEELRQALTIEPSPDFTRGVRARIDTRFAAAVTHRRRWHVGLAAAAACVLAFGLGWRTTTVRSLPAEATTKAGSDVRLPAIWAAPAPTRARRETAVRFRRIVPQPEPVLIVSPDRARGLARLLTLTRSGAVNEDTLRPYAPAALPAVLSVEPLVVPSIAVPTVETQTVGPREGTGRE
jgi:hypothetical protein